MLLVGASAFSQSITPDDRLSARYSASQLESMDDARIAFWNYYLDHSFSIMDIALEKTESLSTLELIDIDPKTFNGFTIMMDEYHAEGAYLKIKGESKMLVIKSMKLITEEFNTFYQSQK